MTYGSLSGSRIGPFTLALNTTLAYENEYNSGIWFFFFFFFGEYKLKINKTVIFFPLIVRCDSILLKVWYIMMGKLMDALKTLV